MTSNLEQEIREQPEAIARLLDRETEHVLRLVEQLPSFRYIVIAARGSSDHAALYAKYVWGALARYPVLLATPSLYTLYNRPPRMDESLVVCVSQSGQSPDILAVLEEAKRQNSPTLAITNDAGSPLAEEADHVVKLHAGAEQSVAATKTYTAQLAVMALLAAAWCDERDRLEEIRRLPEAVASTLEATLGIAERAQRYRYMEHCAVIGRGYNYATAFELALKLKELTYISVTAYSSADFRHGPAATVDEGYPVIMVMPEDPTFTDMLSLAEDLKERGAELLVVTDNERALSMANTPLFLAVSTPGWLNPITAIIPGQMFALHLTRAKTLDPDRPRTLQKVTRTT